MNRAVKCAECECAPSECAGDEYSNGIQLCANCSKNDACCCLSIHKGKEKGCCSEPGCNSSPPLYLGREPRNKNSLNKKSLLVMAETHQKVGPRSFFSYAKGLYAAALGIEILCISAPEIGENTGLYIFGFNLSGIAIAYVMGYSLAGFTTFVTILGRFGTRQCDEKGYTKSAEIESCCSVLEQDSSLGFVSNIKTTFTNFAVGFTRLLHIRNQSELKSILKSSLFILVTAESACILTAETVDLIFYQYSVLLSVPLALMAGAFKVVAPAAYRKSRQSDTTARTAKTF
jgi:hypothetical protein